MRPSNSEITERFEQHLNDQFLKERRKTRSLATGKRHSYVDTHLREVPWRAAEIMSRIRWNHPELVMDEDEFLDDIAARGHDLLEDGFGEQCEKSCNKKPTCPEHYVRLSQDTRKRLVQIGLQYHDAFSSVDEMRALSKDFSIEDKHERNLEFYLRLRKQPFKTKVKKLGDNWHNGDTLHARGFVKALENYVKIRASWPIIFTPEELNVLCEADVNMIEDPESMVHRTFLFEQLLEALKVGRDLPDRSLPFCSMPIPDDPSGGVLMDSESPAYLYEKAVEGLEVSIAPDIRQKIRNVCLPGVLYGAAGGAEIPVAAERQIFMADIIETRRLDALCMFLELGLGVFHQTLTPLMFEDYEMCLGKTGCSPAPACSVEDWGMMRAFVDAVGMNGNELMRLRDEREFEKIVKEAIVREKAKMRLGGVAQSKR